MNPDTSPHMNKPHTECCMWGGDRGWPINEHGVCKEFCGSSECTKYGPITRPDLVPDAEYIGWCAEAFEGGER
jgi:hypothetical protein